MKIACFELETWEKDYLKEKFEHTLEITFHSDTLSQKNAKEAESAEGIVIFIYSSITKEVLDLLPNLKFITTMSTGFDHIDIEECKRRHIIVSTVPTYGENTVAEHTFALIFTISRRIIESHDRVKDGSFSPIGLTGFDLFGKTLGVVGVGSIGTHVIRIAKGIGMDVIAYKRTPDVKLAQDLGFRFVEMNELLSESDIITLHVPYNKDTHHLLDSAAFSKMKDGVIIINTARGAIINTDSLVSALNNGKVAAAGLDVLEEEKALAEENELLHTSFQTEDLKTVLENHMLLNNPKVVITPHNAFNSREALARILNTTQENILGFLAGSPKNLAY
ncbi:MAG: hydroxyacid dehydrogenase [Candidatus Levybacteria bacterium RIFCSPHIGHO2_01_FULL_40_10]|nr:MAG: hydroxyacid dehydrogenase [Candidatus Levybacteria bacterium RIFCSPHIGHO2_01_FULL_40_10]